MYDTCYIAPITISTLRRIVIRAFQTMNIASIVRQSRYKEHRGRSSFHSQDVLSS